MNILILGPQGSGKSTQAKLLGEYLGVPVFDVGSFLRKMAASNIPEAAKIKAAMQKGELVDEDLVISLVKSQLSQAKYRKGVVMDGAARTLRQAEELLGKVDYVFYLDLPDEIAKQRLIKRGRFDDTPDAIAKRLETYHREVQPVLDYFQRMGILRRVDAACSIKEVFESIKEQLPQK
jgi:adenylate kinase